MVNKEIKIKYVYIIDYLLGFILIKYYSLRDTSIFLLLSLKASSFWKSTRNIPKTMFSSENRIFPRINNEILSSNLKHQITFP